MHKRSAECFFDGGREIDRPRVGVERIGIEPPYSEYIVDHPVEAIDILPRTPQVGLLPLWGRATRQAVEGQPQRSKRSAEFMCDRMEEVALLEHQPGLTAGRPQEEYEAEADEDGKHARLACDHPPVAASSRFDGGYRLSADDDTRRGLGTQSTARNQSEFRLESKALPEQFDRWRLISGLEDGAQPLFGLEAQSLDRGVLLLEHRIPCPPEGIGPPAELNAEERAQQCDQQGEARPPHRGRIRLAQLQGTSGLNGSSSRGPDNMRYNDGVVRIPLLVTAGALVLAAGFYGSLQGAGEPVPNAPDAGVRVLPFGIMSEVRDPSMVVPGQVQIYNGSEEGIELVSLRVSTPSGAVAEVPLHSEALPGDAGQLWETYRTMEMLDPELTHRHRNRMFIPLEDRVELSPAENADLFQRVVEHVRRLQKTPALPMRNIKFEVDLQKLFPAGSQPGDKALLLVDLAYRTPSGAFLAASVQQDVTWLPSWRPPTSAYLNRLNSTAGYYVRGDLHVHNCRDEATGGCPSCAAESVNISGAYTNAELKPQFQALGFDFFSTTTHSYCINSNAEFQDVVNESNALTDANFIVICGTEVSGRETGPQTGTDLADLMCYSGFGHPVYHLGAHGITSRFPGGDDGFLDFCDSPIYGIGQNQYNVNKQGGFSIANHPSASLWGFNSVRDMHDVIHWGVAGVEIWNGSEGSPDHLGWWVHQLLAGDVLFAYSGSDTHDAAYDFAATHVFMEGSYAPRNLIDQLHHGRTYVSNGPFLAVTGHDTGGRAATMGDIIPFSRSQIGSSYPITIEAHYDMGGDSGRVRIYQGIVGASYESVVAERTGVSGTGVISAADTLEVGSQSYYRVEFLGNSTKAYTSPIFMIPKN